jgi:hypothetical protein
LPGWMKLRMEILLMVKGSAVGAALWLG